MSQIKIEEKPKVYSASSNPQHVVILGGGFAGIGVLKKLQKKFQNDNNVEITLVSKDNYLLFTPMLPEIVSGMIETRHIVTPVRSFCKKANYFEADVKAIDLENKKVSLSHNIGRQNIQQSVEQHEHTLKYDYLVIAMGSENNFFGNKDIEENSFTMKTINDAITLRNHVIRVLEQAHLEQENKDLRKSLLTFVIVGGGFSGVETVGSVNDFVRETIKQYYPNIYMTEVRIVLVSATDKILEQIDEELGKFALEKLEESGVEFIMNSKVKGASKDKAILDNDTTIPCHTIIWTAGITQNELIANLQCEHAKGHRITTNNFLEVKDYESQVYALGDCASVTDPHTGKPYPPTAQHAIRQSDVAAENITMEIFAKRRGKENLEENKKRKFDYKTKGMMAQIGKRTGVAILFDRIKLHGFLAWWLWRTYYLANLPTIKKKLKVIEDWTSDIIFKPDVSQVQ
ncbi:MAG: NAD(P)/FAD-dependent oxidoreductase [Candidatus Nitrosocosmicus sp.]